ncbi:MAG: noncanonical pyrimidine nucleotidase, YjjG family [Chloroflexi bacterium HGW-Chloroflexi-2]|jgi:2-haloacid dehalogenase|nr:MAG: noncanonical pyrimidine nucleotidase, YjjG family [Chloroflexi bacterium HGW-Chloroflexi-2]
MPPYTWLLFDADGTLFAYDGAEEEALQNVFAHYQLPFNEEVAAAYKRINQTMWRQLEEQTITLMDLRWQRFADLFAALGIDQDVLAFSRTYLHYLGQAADLIPGSWEVLKQLHGKYNLAIITNGITEVQLSRIRISGLGRFFPHVFTSEALGVFKPDRGFFSAVFEEIGQPLKENVLVIGDSLSSDMAGGVDYGLDTCWYNPRGDQDTNGYPITYEIRELAQILEILKIADAK